MIDLQTLSTLLSINETQMVQDLVSTVMSSPQVTHFLQEHPGFLKHIHTHVEKWGQTIPTQMKNIPAPDDLQQEYILYLDAQGLGPSEFQAHSTRMLLQLQNSNFYPDAHQLLDDLHRQNVANRKDLFMQKWRESMANRILALEITFAEQERERLLEELEERMKVAGELDLSLAPQHPGKLWDLTENHLIRGHSKLFRHYATFLKNNPELRKIADQLGRAAKQTSHLNEQIVRAEVNTMKTVTTTNVPDDLVGIYQNNELNRLVPSETVLLTDPALEGVFYKQYTERRLLNYLFAGESQEPTIHIDEHREFSQADNIKGPFLICIDTSGSMSGYPEDSAKGFCLALLQIAIEEKRDCVIMLFSTDVVTYELTGAYGLEEALNFLSASFKGGTDLEPCMHKIMHYMQEGDFANADAVVLSDFIAQRLSLNTEQQALAVKRNGNRFNAVNLSRHGKPAVMKIFDNIWQFDTSLSGRILRKVR